MRGDPRCHRHGEKRDFLNYTGGTGGTAVSVSMDEENVLMAIMERAPRQVAVKVSPEGDKLITSGAHYLHMSKKDLVEAAVAFYLDARREEMQAGMRKLLSELDGSRAARIAMLAGMTRAELDSVGGAQ